ncbi:hypothetical protein JZ751_016101 [Albula glossodonta]|uniref:Uncharacterized protein n=1 Tax=Albula glossodonta TaxID=121402 RepID=A0A8T2NRB0_9TELE|nr:hypothetical protein JZ751_016101 [Albula glossodonta]
MTSILEKKKKKKLPCPTSFLGVDGRGVQDIKALMIATDHLPLQCKRRVSSETFTEGALPSQTEPC